MESLNTENESVDLAVGVGPAVATDNQSQITPEVVPADDFIPAGASSGQLLEPTNDDVASGETIPSGFGKPHREDGS